MDPKTEEFIGLVQTAGWSQAEVARRLHITPGAVSQLFNGKTRPRPATLNLLKLLVAEVKPGALKLYNKSRAGALADWENDLLEPLRRVGETDRERLLPLLHDTIRLVQGGGRRRTG